MFSDKSSVQIIIETQQFVRRRPGEKFNEDCVRQKVKHPTAVMIWGVISGKGPGRLYVVEGNMRQDQYIHVLKTALLPQITEWYGRRDNYIFMQDGAPCHKAKTVMTFLKSRKLRLLDWPGNSPDLNPIENVWSVLKMELGELNIRTNI